MVGIYGDQEKYIILVVDGYWQVQRLSNYRDFLMLYIQFPFAPCLILGK